ncbi:hypothetical protein A3F45_01305 [Candidatus Curtissbacteria bacterium RIFCSPHIGHO2_12_FULL_41_17]|uniref:GTPase Obg n=1 Tax=Candidatus Curtissbacteria bacterium RIFCSPHIGHO2_12_FULL_41_17 TaxID=1797722 RepID=A0A1F5HM87_9BACT|nr:MAG: hypothetical protein A3F45_01305 [Candidatus Curtissbacteria bacterium RIFCSPHIGHO2_12_FULL_41_17]
MIDYARITVKAGDGGDGAGSFHHIKGKRRGKADGGSGGNGGNVYCQATFNLNTLEPYRFVKDYNAWDGQRGAPNLRKGANGEDLVLKVPVGTMVKVQSAKFKVQSEEPKFSRDKLSTSDIDFDLASEGDKILVARGGQGGRGNAYLRDEYGRRPLSGEKGELGESVNLILELKLIADVGLIGLPNSGKSTLLAALAAAKPAIAPYPFTTLEPNLGVLNKSSKSIKGTKSTKSLEEWKETLGTRGTHEARDTLVLADIPGLIEGASAGKGLGDLFLRHVERTKILLHLIDLATNSEKFADYQTIRNELTTYSKDLPAHSGLKPSGSKTGGHGLVKKREIIVLTKSDLVSKEKAKLTVELFKAKKKRVVLISCVSQEGLKELAEMLFKLKES